MRINILDNFDIELSSIWKYELELISEELKIEKRKKYTREEHEHMSYLYHNVIGICIEYGKSYLTKKRSKDPYITFRNIYKENKYLEKRIELGFFGFNRELYYLNQKILIPKEEKNFDYWFALKLSQFDSGIKYIDEFLDYHLEKTFEKNIQEYTNFITLLLRQYEDTLLTEKVTETAIEFVDFLQEEIDEKIENNTNNVSFKPKGKNHSKGSYILIASKTSPNYFIKNNQKFVDIFEQLKEKGYIHPSTLYTQFKALFSGEPITSENRIHWTAKTVDLKAFVVFLSDKKIIEKPNSGIWVLTSQCFIDKNKQEFNHRSIGNAVPSEDTKYIIRKLLSRFPQK